MHIVNREPQRAEFEPNACNRIVSSQVCSLDYKAAGDISPCLTRLRVVPFGSIDVFKHEGRGIRYAYRRLDHIRSDHVDDFLISLPIRGKSTFLQMGTQVALEPGSFIISSTSRPFVISLAAEDRHRGFEQYIARISGPQLRARVPRIDAYCHKPVKVGPGAGTIMASLFALAMREGGALSQSQSRGFGGMLIDAIANTARDAPELLEPRPEPRQSAYARVREEAGHYIGCHLSNPGLSPALIAAHCGISVGYLHAAFAPAPKTLGALIREARLERCRAALRSPDLRDHAVFEIALRWGFNNPAHFSRAYKARYGKSPREDRAWPATAARRD